MNQNTYVVENENEAILIDASAELEDIKAVVEGKKVIAVLMTHIHFDHFWNIDKILNEFGCKVYVCENFEEKFFDSVKNCSVIVGYELSKKIKKEQIAYYDEKLKVGSFEIDVLFAPGHSADCVCLKIGDWLFSGDTLFADGIGRTDLYDSNEKDIIKSMEKLKSLEYKILYPGHFETSTKERADEIIRYYL